MDIRAAMRMVKCEQLPPRARRQIRAELERLLATGALTSAGAEAVLTLIGNVAAELNESQARLLEFAAGSRSKAVREELQHLARLMREEMPPPPALPGVESR